MPSLRLLVLWTDNLEMMMSFYSVIGFEFTKEKHGKGADHYSAKLENGAFELYAGRARETHLVRIGFAVPDLDKVLNDLRLMVVTMPTKTPWGYRAVLEDPDGRMVELYQEGKS